MQERGREKDERKRRETREGDERERERTWKRFVSENESETLRQSWKMVSEEKKGQIGDVINNAKIHFSCCQRHACILLYSFDSNECT